MRSRASSAMTGKNTVVWDVTQEIGSFPSEMVLTGKNTA
jgi:hypothetical protein